MADTKITALTALTAADPANDVIPIVDVSDTSMAASGTTKKISVNNILSSSPTASGALTVTGLVTAGSATITGNLTVDTNTFFVDSANNRVGVGTASPITPWDVRSNGNAAALFLRTTDPAAAVSSAYIQAPVSTGFSSTVPVYGFWYQNSGMGNPAADTLNWIIASGEAMRLNSTGLGIGVTPSAWGGGYKTIANLLYADYYSNNGGIIGISGNAYNNGTSWIYKNTTAAHRYEQSIGSGHIWFNAPSGTAGNAITFTQAMTLAANGQLLLGTSTTDGAIDIGMVLNKPSATGFVGNSYQLNGSSKAFTYISSAAGAFRVDTVTGYTINMVSATNGVYLANGGTSWTALSDERFKDIIEPISNAVAKVGSIRSVIGKFKTESEGTRRSFLIAQDVQAVLPEAVDASNPEKLGVSYTEVIPLLVAAIKELTARVQTLEAK